MSEATIPDRNTLPLAVGRLFELNNYSVTYDQHCHGAQVDLVAHSLSDNFAAPIYIEVTVEKVDTAKYGKDCTKFVLLREKNPAATLLLVSTVGFTAEVLERASASRITALTYGQLLQEFERFKPYIDTITSQHHIISLNQFYEEPQFEDRNGIDKATHWLTQWRDQTGSSANWLIILGEYGTGKTALTQVLQYRWIQDYLADPRKPIPIRIELRNFVKQFDANSLLHHFLDQNKLSHIPLTYIYHLIAEQRIILLLDGYDEMAQFLNARERRSCLQALATLAGQGTGGAKGILTSRPNYFTEAEELHVFDMLYHTLQSQYSLGHEERKFLQSEKEIDHILENYILKRYERELKDLTQEQTESLVRRRLAQNSTAQELVLEVLRTLYRWESNSQRTSLGGKPVIISYLLEIVDDIDQEPSAVTDPDLTEWKVYKLIVDRLMIRDQRRSPSIAPTTRRRFLQSLALKLSARDISVATQEIFFNIIDVVFRNELRGLESDERIIRREQYFADLRSSTTLTRASDGEKSGWVFSHNSLREYLLCEHFVNHLNNAQPFPSGIPVSEAMVSFIGSLQAEGKHEFLERLRTAWGSRSLGANEFGGYVALGWHLITNTGGGQSDELHRTFGLSTNKCIDFSRARYTRIDFRKISSGEERRKFDWGDSEISECNFSGASFRNSSLRSAIIDSSDFSGSDLENTNFDYAYIFECIFDQTKLSGSSVKNIDPDSSIIIRGRRGEFIRLEKEDLRGYLSFHGADVGSLGAYFRLQFDPKFGILMKICERLTTQRKSQLRGLTQRGEAQADPPFARRCVEIMEKNKWAETDMNKLVTLTPEGRNVIGGFMDAQNMPTELADLFDE